MNQTYKILLVDDELIILSGLKYLIDWTHINCEIVGTASNGRDALDKIEFYKPDIVICDINMPVYDGVQVLKKVQNSPNYCAFIMLTNHQEFHLVQQALKYQAVDYILKTNLNPNILIESIENAKKVCDLRKKMLDVDSVENYLTTNSKKTAKKCLEEFILNKAWEIPTPIRNICCDVGIFQDYRLIQLYILPPKVLHYDTFTLEEKKKLYQCEKDIIDKICKNFFEHYFVFDQQDNTVLIFIYKSHNIRSTHLQQFYKRLSVASKTVVETPIQMIATENIRGEEHFGECLAQWKALQKIYFYSAMDIILSPANQHQKPGPPMELSLYIQQLSKGLLSGSPSEIQHTLHNFMEALERTMDEPAKVINDTIQLYHYILSTLQSPNYADFFSKTFSHSVDEIDKLRHLHTYEAVVQWIHNLCNKIDNFYNLVQSKPNNLIDDAREYIIHNIQQKLTLSSVAQYLNITPSYLSTLFKKECQQNFVDYVNQLKIQEACILLGESDLLIYEIAHKLGFDNPYYFTRIFRKYKGMTPKEYIILNRK